jgi:cell division protein FtsB
VNRGRVAVAVVIAAALVFAFAAGEYGTLDWYQVWRAEQGERAAIEVLKRQVDSLQKVAASLEKDPRTQERVAREEFGMIRKGEHMYRLVPDSGEDDR